MSHNPHEVRIGVAGLGLRMYVSRLDRPWIETPFLLEGLLVSSEEDVANLRRTCQHVYVDVTRGIRPDPRWIEPDDSELLRHAHGHDEIASLHKRDWLVTTHFEAELPVAKKAHLLLEHGIEEVMTDVQNGRALDLPKVQAGVEAMIDSIARNPTAFVWLKAIKRKSDYGYQHALGCSLWAASFGRHLGMAREEVSELALSGLLFDVGKTRLPGELLSKCGAFDHADSQTMRRHVEESVRILEQTVGMPPRIIEAVATHHERHDGSGYPHRLEGAGIPIFGRILGLIDSYDAMTCVRPHAGSRSPHQAVMELYNARDILFQADIVEQFIQTCGVYPTGSLVELSDGRVAVVTAVHDLKRLRPRVMVLLDRDKRPLAQFEAIDMSHVPADANGRPLNIQRGLPQGAFGLDPAELFLD